MKKVKILLMSALILWPALSLGSVETHIGVIKTTLSDTQNFGHCMIRLDYESTIDCNDRWVSLDCRGSFNSKETSRRLWESAQLAFALDSTIFLVINDAKKHNGFCVADRLDVAK